MRRKGFKHGRVLDLRAYGQAWPGGLDPPKGPLLGAQGSHGQYVLCHKPTNFTFQTGKCKRPRCYDCHDTPVDKSLGKTHSGFAKRGKKRMVQEYRAYHAPDWVIPVRQAAILIPGVVAWGEEEAEDQGVELSEDQGGGCTKSVDIELRECGPEEESGEVGSRLDPGQDRGGSSGDEDWECLNGVDYHSDCGCSTDSWELVDVD